jgi:hypothetical protein
METKIKVTKHAMILRLNRYLAHAGQKIKAARGERMINEVGYYYMVAMDHNAIIDQNVDPEGYARELGVLQPYEEVTY